MSASERLKALADLDASTGIGHIKTCTALRAALPQIVAVVEAAEVEVFATLLSDEDGRAAVAIDLDDWRKVRDALAALEEALS